MGIRNRKGTAQPRPHPKLVDRRLGETRRILDRIMGDEDVRRWYELRSLNSENTGRKYAYYLGAFCEQNKLTPRSAADLAKNDLEEFNRIYQDWCIRVIGKVAPKTASVYIAGVKSWLEHKGVNLKLVASVKVPHQNSTPTVDDEEVPSQEQLRHILNYADDRQRSIIALIAFSGIRFETISRLKLSDLIEAKLTSEGVQFPKHPTMIHCGPEATKKDNRYFTLLIREGCEYLKAYIDRRTRQGEGLTAGSPVISSDDKRYRGKALTSHQLSELVRKCFDDAGLKARPYVLRGFFDTAMLSTKSLKHTWQQFFMGHKGDIEAAYTTRKKLGPELLERMREAFAPCEAFLTTLPSQGEEGELATLRTMVESGVLDLSKESVRNYLAQKLQIQGLEVRVAKMKEEGFGEEEAYGRTLCGHLGIDPMKLELFKRKENGDPKKIIDERELQGYLVQGWDVQTVLPSGKILVRK